MRLRLQPIALMAIACLLVFTAKSQTTTVSGTVTSKGTGQGVPAVSVTIKGSGSGVYTDDKGNFKLTTTQKPPFTLVFSSVGYDNQEVNVSTSGQTVNVSLVESYKLGEDVVVAATRVAERRLESPVTVERVTAATIRNAPAPTYYDILANLKGVDVVTSSLNFKTPSTRGFNGSGNLRFNQLVDGMDNQAPGLNFSVGSIIGLTELDVDNMELLVGASSALYGSGGMNGTLLINSKNPFKYQGLSFQIKQGVNHVDNKQRRPAPYYDWSLRWGKKVTEKFAFKIGAQLVQAQDWQATDTRNLLRNNVLSELKGGDRTTDPNYDGVNVFGDEASASMASIAQAAIFNPATNPTLGTVTTTLATMLGRAPTPNEIVGFYAGNAAYGPLNIYARGLAQGFYGGQLVSRTGYNEKDLVDYNNYNVKLSGGLYYKITNDIEASLLLNWGTGTTVYTGADRYSIKNLIMGQYKLEVKGKNWMVKGYTTQENSGDSYTATTAAVAVNRAWKSDATWFGTYSAAYSQARISGAPDAQAHAAARSAADNGRLLPGTPGFQTAFNNAIGTPISKGGAKFADKSDMYHLEGQLNLSQYLNDVVEVLVGSHWRQYVLNSQGTIFADTAGPIKINEYGAYIQLQKKLFDNKLKLTASTRYDKNENFEGRFTPRVSAVISPVKDHNIRLSYQTAYRFPSTQDQWINLQTPASRLIGGLPEFNTFFKFDQSPAFTAESIVAYRASISAGAPNPTLLKQAPFSNLKPESVQSYEIGYRGLMLQQRLMIDVYGYYSKYSDFLGRVAVGRGQSANPSLAVQAQELASPFTTTNYSFVTNTTTPVKALGWGMGAEYRVYKGYNLTGNVYSDELRDVPAGFVTFFNTPKYRVNLGLNNQDVYKGLGFGIQWKWQDKTNWEGTFGSAEIPSFNTLDMMVSYKIPKIRSMIKIGGSNITNNYYQSAFGNPYIGGLYYVSFGYNVF